MKSVTKQIIMSAYKHTDKLQHKSRIYKTYLKLKFDLLDISNIRFHIIIKICGLMTRQ